MGPPSPPPLSRKRERDFSGLMRELQRSWLQFLFRLREREGKPPRDHSSKRKCRTDLPCRRISFKASMPTLMWLST